MRNNGFLRIGSGWYRNIEELETGSRSRNKLFTAERRDGRIVVIKLAGNPEEASDSGLETEFRVYGEKAVRNCPHIVEIVGQGRIDGRPALVLESMDMDLSTYLGLLKQPPALSTLLHWCRDVAAALECLHRAGWRHLDVKAANLLVNRGGRNLKLADFGTATPLSVGKTDIKAGTEKLMAPEQAIPLERHADASDAGRFVFATDQRTDLFALGLLLFQWVTGRATLESQTLIRSLTVEQAREQRQDLGGISELECLDFRDGVLRLMGAGEELTAVPHGEARQDGPEALADATLSLLRGLLARNPQERPSSADRVVRELDRLLKQLDQPLAPETVAARFGQSPSMAFEGSHPVGIRRGIGKSGWVATLAAVLLAITVVWWSLPTETPKTVSEPLYQGSDTPFEDVEDASMSRQALGYGLVQQSSPTGAATITVTDPAAIVAAVSAPGKSALSQASKPEDNEKVRANPVVTAGQTLMPEKPVTNGNARETGLPPPAATVAQPPDAGPIVVQKIDNADDTGSERMPPSRKQLVPVTPADTLADRPSGKSTPPKNIPQDSSIAAPKAMPPDTDAAEGLLSDAVAASRDVTALKTLPSPSILDPGKSAADASRKLQAHLPGEAVAGIPFPAMVPIKGGEFLMGRDDGDPDEAPAHPVTITDFHVSATEISQSEYLAFCLDRGKACSTVTNKRGELPVTGISRREARDYTQWLSDITGLKYRLITESEWEYLAVTAYPAFPKGAPVIANHVQDVNSKPADHNGLRGLLGNVWEWVEDCAHVNYRKAPEDGRAWREQNAGNCRLGIARGGSWFDIAEKSTPWNRLFIPGSSRLEHVGFRVALGN